MGAPALDNEFLKYWLKLSVAEKESLLTVAKNYVQLKESEEDVVGWFLPIAFASQAE